jgi:hypothetical protein
VFERFTDDARAVVKGAVAEATRRDSPVVGVEHVLVLLARTEPPTSPVTAAALRDAGLTPDGLAALLDDLELAARRGGLGAADAEALQSLGIDLDAIVAGIEQAHGRGALAPPQPLYCRTQRLRRRFAARARGRGRRTAREILGEQPPVRHRPWTPDAKRAMEHGLRQALAAGDDVIRPEHLLLGILSAGDPVARALTARGITAEQLRTALKRAS